MNEWLTHPLYVRNTNFVPRMAQTPKVELVELATIHTLTIQDVSLAVQSNGASLCPIVSEIYTIENFGQQ